MEIQQSVHETIQATIEQITANGIEYEQFLRNIHKDNPQYEFFRPNSKHYHYYLKHLAEALRPTTAHQQKHSGWTSLPQNTTTTSSLESMQVGLMCQIVKEAARKGMEPYSTLSSEDVSRLMLEVLAADRRESTGLQSQAKQLLSFLEDAKRESKKQRQALEATKKLQQQQAQQAKKDKRSAQLPGRLLTSEMGISHDGSVTGGLSGRYQGLGRSSDPYENFRRGQRR